MFSSTWRNRIERAKNHARRFRDRDSDKTLALMYHRVANPGADPWQLAVNPENFERQLQILKSDYDVISVTELVERLGKKSVSPKTVCLTFDDGYRDNYLTAKPLLEKYECPAAFFVSAHYIDRQEHFWWDALQEIILDSEALPAAFSLTIDQKSYEFESADETLTAEQRQLQKSWVWYEKPPTERCGLYLKIYNILKPLPYIEIRAALEKLKRLLNFEENTENSYLPMTKSQLQEIAANPLFEVANHTLTHPGLKFHSAEFQSEEFRDCESYLNENCERFNRVLAYPYGEYSGATLATVRKLKLPAAFATKEQPITNRSNIYELGRFQINDWTAREFEAQIARWQKDY